jgi:hypothetical protein
MSQLTHIQLKNGVPLQSTSMTLEYASRLQALHVSHALPRSKLALNLLRGIAHIAQCGVAKLTIISARVTLHCFFEAIEALLKGPARLRREYRGIRSCRRASSGRPTKTRSVRACHRSRRLHEHTDGRVRYRGQLHKRSLLTELRSAKNSDGFRRIFRRLARQSCCA